MVRWVELLVEGNEDMIRAFVAGFVAGRGTAEEHEVISGRDVDLAPASFGERLREVLSMRSRAVVLAVEALGRALAEAIAQQGVGLGVSVRHATPIAAARLAIQAEVFDRSDATAVKGLLGTPPDGVEVEKDTEAEEEHGEARGVELYAPLHGYAYRVSARASGDVGGVLALRSRLGNVAGVQVGPLYVDGE